jgi:hypothetical protein
VGCHFGNGECGLDALVACAIIVKVDKSLGLGTEVVFGGELGWGVTLRQAWDGVHAVEEGADATLAEEGETCVDCVLVALWLRRLGVMEEEGVKQKKELEEGQG